MEVLASYPPKCEVTVYEDDDYSYINLFYVETVDASADLIKQMQDKEDARQALQARNLNIFERVAARSEAARIAAQEAAALQAAEMEVEA